MNVALAVVGAVLENVAEHRFERGEAGAAGDHQEWAGAAAVDELADGAFDAEQGAVCQGGSCGWLAGRGKANLRNAGRRLAGASKQTLCESATRHAADVQLEEIAVMGRARD